MQLTGAESASYILCLSRQRCDCGCECDGQPYAFTLVIQLSGPVETDCQGRSISITLFTNMTTITRLRTGILA